MVGKYSDELARGCPYPGEDTTERPRLYERKATGNRFAARSGLTCRFRHVFLTAPQAVAGMMLVAATIQPQESHAVFRTLALSAALALAAQPLLAQDRAALRDACAKDVATHCPGVMPGGGRIAACFKQNLPKLSEGCRAALKANATAAN